MKFGAKNIAMNWREPKNEREWRAVIGFDNQRFNVSMVRKELGSDFAEVV